MEYCFKNHVLDSEISRVQSALARKLIEAVEAIGGSHLPAYNRAIDDAAKVMRDTCKKLGVDVGGTS